MEAKKIGAAKFKEQCLAILDSLDADGVIVTKHGKPVARVLPMPQSPADMIGVLKDKLTVHGDIMTAGIEWESDG